MGDEGRHGARRACRIEPGEPTVRAHPVHAGARLDEAVDRHRGQALALAVVDEAMAVEPAEPVDRAEPQKAARVLYNAEDTIVAETIRRGIRARRQAFGERMRSRERHHRRARHHAEPLHRASPNRMSGAHRLPMAAFRVSVCLGPPAVQTALCVAGGLLSLNVDQIALIVGRRLQTPINGPSIAEWRSTE